MTKLNQLLINKNLFGSAIHSDVAMFYLLIEQKEGVAQFEGTWDVNFDGVHRFLAISKEGIGVVKKTVLPDGSLKPEWNYTFSLTHDMDNDFYIWEQPWEENDIQAFEINGKTLIVTMMKKDGYPDKKIGKCKGQRVKKK